MTRLSKLTVDELPDDVRAMVRAETATPLELGLTRMFAHYPEGTKGMSAFAGALKRNRTLSARLVELVRLRVAFHNQCRSCMAIRYTDAIADGVTEDLVCSLATPMEATDLTDAEKVAIRFGELMATNHLAVDDAFYDRLREHFSESQIVELGFNVALFVGIGRFAATLHMVEELPEYFQQDDNEAPLAPWGNAAIVVR